MHQGKTQVWNQAGEEPLGCDELQMAAVIADETAIVWRGSDELPSHRCGIKVLGTPLGHPDFVRAHLEMLTAEHQTLLHRIPLVEDTQSAWLLLVHCAAARANYTAKVVAPKSAEEFCRRHDEGLWRCLCDILQIPAEQADEVWSAASMPMVLGGVGLRSAVRVSRPAYWSSWVDCLQ